MVLKRRFVFGVIVAVLLFAGSTRAEELESVPVCDYIRLHVVAEDDSAAAQALKLEVRDACLTAARALLSDCDGTDEAWQRIGENLPVLSDAAIRRAQELGYEGAVAAQTGVFDFPDRHYGGVFVPAGAYRALRVVIGEGEGHNWWCVLYPSLCLPENVEPGAPVVFHSAILDWLRNLFGGEG